MLRSVIYDMDGVLADTEPLHYRVNKEMLGKMGVVLEEDYYKQFIGSTNGYMWKTIIDRFGLAYTPEELNEMQAKQKAAIIEKEGYPPIPFAAQGVRNLYDAGVKLAVASSSCQHDIEKVTRYFGITDCFDQLVSGESVKHPKPAPDVFLLAAKMLGVEPKECIVIEDSANGVEAAKAAGMTCIGLACSDFSGQDLSKADYIITSHECISKEFVEMVYAHSNSEP